MTGSTRSPTCAALASLAALVLLLPATSGAAGPRQPLPVYLEDNHAGTFQFLATTLNLDAPHVLVLVDAHSDSSRPAMLDEVRVGLRRVVTPGERDARISGWRRAGALQSFDWILPLMPAPLSRVLWVKADPEPRAGAEAAPLPAGFASCPLEELGTRIAEGEAVVVSIDLDAFAGTSAAEQEARFARVWSRVTSLPRLAAVSFAISRPWLADDAEASRLVLLASRASLALAHATFRFEPWGIEGPDRSERAKAFYLQRKEPPRFDPETVSPELRTLLLANADRLEVRIDHARWHDLLARWRAEGSDWRITLQGLAADSDHVFRPGPERAPDLRVEGGPAGRVRRVTWLGWTPRAWSYDVLPELPSGKVFAGAAPPVIDYESHVLARTGSPTLDAEAWMAALPGPDRSGVLRVSAEVETVDGVAHTARLELRRAAGTGFRAGLSEQFGLPYVFGAGFLRRGGLTGPDTGVGNDCANFLVSAWRRSGLPMAWSNPAQLRRHLASVARDASASHRVVIPSDASARGLVVHLGSHVAALWEDRPPLGTLGPEDLMVHHLGGAPEILSLEKLLAGRRSPTFDVYLGPPRRPTRWIAVGGDVMPGDGAPPEAIRRRLRAADLAVANLETTVGSAGRPVEKRYTFQIPSARLADLRGLPLSAVSLGNNHTGDFGVEGLAGTLAALDASGVGHFGAGDDVQAAVSPWYVEVKGVTVAFVAASLTDPDLLPAGERRSGIAVLPRHERALAAAIARAGRRARCVIAVVHWGAEGTPAVTDEQRRWARWFVEQGASAVIGSGPHVVQAGETIAGVPVYYSLGNLWFHGRWPKASRTAGIAFLGLDGAGRVVAHRLDRIAPATPRPSRALRQASERVTDDQPRHPAGGGVPLLHGGRLDQTAAHERLVEGVDEPVSVWDHAGLSEHPSLVAVQRLRAVEATPAPPGFHCTTTGPRTPGRTCAANDRAQGSRVEGRCPRRRGLRCVATGNIPLPRTRQCSPWFARYRADGDASRLAGTVTGRCYGACVAKRPKPAASSARSEQRSPPWRAPRP